uniref:Uncharacterized protein n=1 Tax=Oryza glaberrima TaxID=4538 RepID=I1QHF8_ORYGL
MAPRLGTSSPRTLALRWNLASSAMAQSSKPSGWLAGWDVSASHNGVGPRHLSAKAPSAEVGHSRLGHGPAQQAFWMVGLGAQRQGVWHGPGVCQRHFAWC